MRGSFVNRSDVRVSAPIARMSENPVGRFRLLLGAPCLRLFVWPTLASNCATTAPVMLWLPAERAALTSAQAAARAAIRAAWRDEARVAYGGGEAGLAALRAERAVARRVRRNERRRLARRECRALQEQAAQGLALAESDE
ncbi:hypothetical protein ACJ73_05863 [Blastomyces percursus]|uniref:Uncharacterized protein n=1 Tax=Blastomyces percursus TaxID=1658174 RepID=A0A1J9Q3W2_9EURO|nr:hypothetical protein ACJ73_05863 [Blastomyces percursus]